MASTKDDIGNNHYIENAVQIILIRMRHIKTPLRNISLAQKFRFDEFSAMLLKIEVYLDAKPLSGDSADVISLTAKRWAYAIHDSVRYVKETGSLCRMNVVKHYYSAAK
uniref:Uncharacterized protein n=1 Tax=Glossina palpalis gambiensis TaxID=67801 RepID=A0A1B0BF21_9MUSC